MASTLIGAVQAFNQAKAIASTGKLVTVMFTHAAAAAQANITLPYYLDIAYPCPVLSILVFNVTDYAATGGIDYNLWNGAASDMVVRTAVAGDQPAAGEFMVGNSAGANPGNIIIVGDATTKNSQYTITALWRDLQ